MVRGKRKGFTLIELIVVLVIMAVLAAAAIPRLLGYVDTTKETLCATNKAELLRMLKADEVAQGQGKKLDTAQLKALFEKILAEEEDLRCTAGGTYTAGRGSDGKVTVTCSVHDDTYGFNMGQVIQDIGSSNPGFLPAKPVDSTAPEKKNNFTDDVTEKLKQMGFDMDAQGIKTWAYKGNTAKKLVYWSTEAISLDDVSEKNYVKVIRYNSRDNTYTAGYVKIDRKILNGKPYPAFTDNDGTTDFYEYKKIAQTDDTKKSFDQTYAVFLKMDPAKTKTPNNP